MAGALAMNYQPEQVVDISKLTREEWLEYRRQGIGGSDVAVIMGISPFATSRDLYYDKIGVKPIIEEEEKNWIAKEVGHSMEDFVAQAFAKATGLEVFPVRIMFRHPYYPFMICDVDFFVRMPDGSYAILECKTTRSNNKAHWADDAIPEHYIYQIRHYMAVMNINKVFIACLFTDDLDFVYRTVDRDMMEEENIIEQESCFWHDFVEKRAEPPLVEKPDLVLSTIRRFSGYADKSISEIQVSGLDARNLEKYMELAEEKAELEKRRKEIDAQQKILSIPFIETLGQGCKAYVEDGANRYRITYNPTKRVQISKESMEKLKLLHPDIYEDYTKVTESRTFRIKKEAA